MSTTRRIAGIGIIALILLAVLAVAGGSAVVIVDAADNSSGHGESDRKNSSHPQIEDQLLRDGDSGGNEAQQSSSEQVQIVVETQPGQADAAERAVTERGEVESRYEHLIQGRVPRDALEELADKESIEFIRAPRRPDQQGTFTSEGVETVRADAAQARGWQGNVTVAVIDIAIDPSHDPIADHVVHTNDTTGRPGGIDGGSGTSTTHGDASAEIVTDVAPGVDLVLISVESYVDLLNAVDYIENNDWGEGESHLNIDAVSMSLGLGGGLPNDGTADLDQAIDASVQNGTVWAISAGNEANGKHWNGTFQDTNGNGFHEFAVEDESVDECNVVSGPVEVILQWNDWPESSQDYDLYLYEVQNDGSVGPRVATSETPQTGMQPPGEVLSWGGPGYYCFTIFRYDADGSADFDVFVAPDGRSMQYSTATRSVVIPATSELATTVGAVKYDTLSLRPYSSRGPTIDGRVKPTLTGPDGVSTDAYGENGYPGTSAAAPHVAGVAALIRDAAPDVDAVNVSTRLQTTADPLGTSTPNNDVGSGLVDAAAAVPPQDPTVTDPPGMIDPDNEAAVLVDISFDHPPKPGTVRVVLTDSNGQTVSNSTALNTSSNTTTVEINATALSDGTVEIAAVTSDVYGWQNPAGITTVSTVEKDTTDRPEITGELALYNESTDALQRVDAFTQDGTLVDRTDVADGGSFALEVPPGESITVVYFQRDPETGTLIRFDENPDLRTLTAGSFDSDTDLGTFTLPEGHELQARVVSEDDTPVENAQVEVRHEKGSSLDSVSADTNSDGLYQFPNSDPGIEVEGNVSLAVTAPDSSDAYVDEVQQKSLTVDQSRTVAVELPLERNLNYYADSESGKIETMGLRDAVGDWREGRIGTGLLRDVIGAWRSGESVESFVSN